MRRKLFLILPFLCLVVSCVTTGPVTVDGPVIDYRLYQGRWYEVARLPNPFEEGLTCITMSYDLQDEGVMIVTSKGRSKSDHDDIKTLTGRAWIPDAKEPGKIKIQFIWPVTKDYLLIHVDETKGYAILGSPFRHQLWILSRKPAVIEEDMTELLKIAEKNQYNAESIIRVEQACD